MLVVGGDGLLIVPCVDSMSGIGRGSLQDVGSRTNGRVLSTFGRARHPISDADLLARWRGHDLTVGLDNSVRSSRVFTRPRLPVTKSAGPAGPGTSH